MSVLDSLFDFAGKHEKEFCMAYLRINSMSGDTFKEKTLETIRAEMKSENPNISLVVEAIRNYRDLNYETRDNGYAELNSIIKRIKN